MLNALKRRMTMDEDQERRLPPPIATVRRPLPDAQIERVRAAATEVEQLRLDRDHAVDEQKRAYALCDQAKNRIIQLEETISDLKARITMYQIERDQAVAETAGAKRTLKNLRSLLDSAELEPAPAQTVASDAEAPNNFQQMQQIDEEIRKLVPLK